MLQGGGRIEDTTLFGKYQLCRVLGRGRSGTVYLARHKGLEEYRAIKQVPKTCSDYDQFRREALILKGIRHPGIPIVYDLEEDEKYSYLIEEFLEGDSLYALISEEGQFSTAMTIHYGIQICHLVSILHSAKPTPILYLDLQPRNLLICHDTVKLIDFDHAVTLEEAGELTLRYGTVGCAAPEQYTKEELDQTTDTYAIGAVLQFMLTGSYDPGAAPVEARCDRMERQLRKIIQKCMSHNRTKRYQTAEQLGTALSKISGKTGGKKGWLKQNRLVENQISSLTVAVAGTRPGVGTTHIAMGLTTYFRCCGSMAMYEEVNDTSAVRQMANALGKKADGSGIVRLFGLPMLPRYGEAVRLEKAEYRIVVRDLGSSWQELLQEQADICLLVCGAKPWEWETTREALTGLGALPGLEVIYNQFCGQMNCRLPGPAKEVLCFRMPYEPNPFRCGKQARRVYQAILKSEMGTRTGGILRKLSGRCREFAARVLRRPAGP